MPHTRPVPPTGAAEAGAWKSTPLASASALVAAKIVFVVTGYAIYAGLSRLLTPSDFGVYLVVNSTVAVLNAVFITGTIQAVSRFVAQGTTGAGATLRAALKLQLVVAGGITALYFLAAPGIAGLLRDEQLIPYLRVSATIPLAYAFYAAIIGYLNGGRRFAWQAGFDVSFSAMKLALVLALPALGYGAFGAVSGFAIAAVLILVLAWSTIGAAAVREKGVGASAAQLLRYEGTVMGHVALTNLLMQLDLLLVKGLSPIAAASTAAAMFGAAAKLAQIPHSILVALNFLIFPYIARSTANAPTAQTTYYIRQALRVGAALVAGPAAILATLSPQAVGFVFGSAYAGAGPVLGVLSWGYVAFSLFAMTSTIINSAGRPGVSLAFAAGTLTIQTLLAWFLIPAQGIVGSAVASSAAYSIGLLAATTYLTVKFGSVVPWSSLARISIGVVTVTVVAPALVANYSFPLVSVVLGLVYLATLAVLREWTLDDFRNILGRPAPAGA